MNIKRIVNAALCAAIASGGVLSHAATPIMASNADDSTLLTYEVTEKYTWTAPSSFEVTESSNGAEVITGTVNVLENVISDGMSLKISIKPNQAFELTDVENPDNKRAYTVKKGDTVINAGDTVLKVAAGVNTGSVDLDFQLDAVDTETAGNYSGTAGFVASIAGLEVDGVNIMLTNDKDGDGYVSKGDTLTFATSYLYSDADSTAPTQFSVLKTLGSSVEVIAKTDYQTGVKFNEEKVTTIDSSGKEVLKYEGSAIDTLLNDTYYNSLTDAAKNRIVTRELSLDTWEGNQHNNNLVKIGTVGTIERKVYALDVQDMVDVGDMYAFFDGNHPRVLLRSAYNGDSSYVYWAVGYYGWLTAYLYNSEEGVARPAFTISLE